ncbi:MAG TPA: undecaprenyldiphospho-muramoylpentapeptide beta-N-acetylglucosaminyltransferase [Thermodesulfobacteriota bacterium]|nr:undecaprenyldiphospho-muramoylpentapeptide beta-N-acetylglucosaminyltransferase [Thermodesulfobacteriota bacterium]
MRIIIAGGGTGGHIFPAISVAEEIIGRNPENKVLFVGTRKGMEGKVLSKTNYPLEYINSGGIAGKNIIQSLRGVALALSGFWGSLEIIRKFNPDAVIGVGGYASGPVILAAWMLRIPTAVCEQNVVPGITNKILGNFVKRVFASFNESVKFFPKDKTMAVGNPIRSSILADGGSNSTRNGFTILVFGGSQGAHKLNLTVPKAFGILGRQDVFLIHQTGDKDLDQVRKTYEWYGIQAEVLPFIENIGNAYKNADLVIGRAGAGTIAEITAIGKPSILVPYPFSAYNHQMENAKVLEKSGAAVVIEDKNMIPESLAETLSRLLRKDTLQEMGERAKSLGKPDAAKRIVDEIYKLCGGNI